MRTQTPVAGIVIWGTDASRVGSAFTTGNGVGITTPPIAVPTITWMSTTPSGVFVSLFETSVPRYRPRLPAYLPTRPASQSCPRPSHPGQADCRTVFQNC